MRLNYIWYIFTNSTTLITDLWTSYDAIHYVRSKADAMVGLIYCTAAITKKIRKTKNKNRVAQKKRSGQLSVKPVQQDF